MKRRALTPVAIETAPAKLPGGVQVMLFVLSLVGALAAFVLTVRYNITRPQGDPNQDVFSVITREVHQFNSR